VAPRSPRLRAQRMPSIISLRNRQMRSNTQKKLLLYTRSEKEDTSNHSSPKGGGKQREESSFKSENKTEEKRKKPADLFLSYAIQKSVLSTSSAKGERKKHGEGNVMV